MQFRQVYLIVLSRASRAHGVALILVSLALSRSPKTRIQSWCIAWYARLLPSFRWYLVGYSLTDPGRMAR